MAKALCTEAERELGGGTGAIKKAKVVTWVYEGLPDILILFIPQSVINKLIEIGLTEAKKIWETNTAVATYIATTAETPIE